MSTLPVSGQQIDLSKVPVDDVSSVQPVYSNQARIIFSQWDLRLQFFEFDFKLNLTTEPMIHPRANVAMTPSHAKLFAQSLLQAISNYEKQFGEIVIPKVIATSVPFATQKQ